MATTGPGTEKVVVAFKRRYNIHYPPTDPEGLVDGYTGPRTMRQLDMNAESLELVSSSIVLKRAQLDGAGIITTPWDPGLYRPEVIPVPGREGGNLPCQIDGIPGAVYHCTSTGAFEVHGPIDTEYVNRGGATGTLGFPISDVEPGPTPDQTRCGSSRAP